MSLENTGFGKSLAFLSAGTELHFTYIRLNVQHSESKEQVGKFCVFCHREQIIEF